MFCSNQLRAISLPKVLFSMSLKILISKLNLPGANELTWNHPWPPANPVPPRSLVKLYTLVTQHGLLATAKHIKSLVWPHHIFCFRVNSMSVMIQIIMADNQNMVHLKHSVSYLMINVQLLSNFLISFPIKSHYAVNFLTTVNPPHYMVYNHKIVTYIAVLKN